MHYTSISTRRGTFGVRLSGDSAAPLVLCQHGFPDDASTFDSLAAVLTGAGFRVAAPNLRGYAPSPLGGRLGLADLVTDLLALFEELSPGRPVGFVGHDYGAQIAYPAMAQAPERFGAAVLLSGAHPALVTHNARRSLRQLWLSRYLVFFQFGRVAERAVSRNDFAYVDRLWRRWAATGYPLPTDHLTAVKRTLATSMPSPIAMYRAGGFDVPQQPINVPTLYVTGADDGCARPFLAEGQQRLFTADYSAEIWPHTGHFPHLEQPQRAARAIVDWLTPRLLPSHPS